MMHSWHWLTQNGQPYLTTSLLADWSHGFFTRRAWSQHSPEELTAMLSEAASAYRAKQVHGNQVLTPADLTGHGDPAHSTLPEADAVVTDAPQQAAWVCTADCTPALIADGARGQVAAVHAGWRGTSLQVLPAAIAHMQRQGSRLENLRVALGPAISGIAYQVTTQVAVAVGRTVVAQAMDDEALLSHLQSLEAPMVLPDPQPGRVRLDLRQINAQQMIQLGLAPEQIAIAPHCTYQEPETFFSYRRSREKKVQWSGIVSR